MILGADGFLGYRLCQSLRKNEIVKCGRGKRNDIILDQTKKNNFSDILSKIKPDVIINLIAITDVDLCEKNKKKANNVNNIMVKNFVRTIRESKLMNKVFFLHISTDQVYSGNGPHKENYTKTENVYSRSKLKGEKYIKKINGCVIRTNFIGKSLIKKKSLSDWVYQSLKNNKKINAFKNVKFSPLNIETLCVYINLIIKKKISGVYNLGSKNGFSKAEFVLKFAKKLNLNTNLIKFIDYKKKMLLAKRPLDMRMNVKRFENKFNVVIKDLNYEIDLLSKEYKKIT